MVEVPIKSKENQDWHKMFVTHFINKGLASIIYRKLLKAIRKIQLKGKASNK